MLLGLPQILHHNAEHNLLAPLGELSLHPKQLLGRASVQALLRHQALVVQDIQYLRLQPMFLLKPDRALPRANSNSPQLRNMLAHRVQQRGLADKQGLVGSLGLAKLQLVNPGPRKVSSSPSAPASLMPLNDGKHYLRTGKASPATGSASSSSTMMT
jgi:hypothetical protein